MVHIMKLYDELYSELLKMEIIDIHEHLNPVQLAAKSFEDILFYHYIVTELVSAGMNRNEFEKLVHKDKLFKALPYFKYIRNTTTFWCLRQILKDLYGLEINSIDENNWRQIIEAVESKVGDKSWAYVVLKGFCKVKKSFLTLSPLEPLPQYDKDLFTGSLRIEPIVQSISKDILLKIEQMYGISIDRAEDLENVVEVIFKSYVNDIVAVAISIQPDDLFRIPYKNEVSLYVKELKLRGTLSNEARMALASFVLHKVISLCLEYKKVVQLMLGVKRPVPLASPPDHAITTYNPRQILDLAHLFAMYPEVKFDIMIADQLLSHPMSVIAKNYSNVYLSGYWWYSMYPETIKSYLRVRLQMLPYNKVGGFFSDAYVAEWVYGKAILVKKQLAYTLAEMIHEGYIDKDLALEIANALLNRNSMNIYSLS